jgi:hypothetical protein
MSRRPTWRGETRTRACQRCGGEIVSVDRSCRRRLCIRCTTELLERLAAEAAAASAPETTVDTGERAP